MKKLIILTGMIYSLVGQTEIWEPPPYQPDENHLPPEERIKQEQEEKPSPVKADQQVKEEKKMDKASKGKAPERILFPVK